MIFTKEDLGPFMPLVGYAIAIATAAYSIRKLLWRKDSVWGIPLEMLDGGIKGIFTAILGGGMVILWLFASPQTTMYYVALLAVLFVTIVIVYFLFSKQIQNNRYYKPRVTGPTQTKLEAFIGGTQYTSTGTRLMNANPDIDEALADVQYKEDLIWTRQSITKVRVGISQKYMAIVVLCFLCLTTAALLVLVKLTEKPATSVITKEQSPGLN